jgi:hypothetical protein
VRRKRRDDRATQTPDVERRETLQITDAHDAVVGRAHRGGKRARAGQRGDRSDEAAA